MVDSRVDVQQRIDAAQAEAPLYVGVDVGGTSIKLGIVDDLGRTLGVSSIPTDEERGPEDAVTRIRAALHELLGSVSVEWNQIAAVGLGTPGSMDIRQGLILEPPNMPHWRYFPLRDRLSEACSKPVSFANDANAAAYGEFWVGSGAQYSSLVMFTLGTGVGGGIILDGNSIDGEHSFGSELGHTYIDQREDARECVWGGGRGQLEAYASAPAVAARAQEALEAGQTSSLQAALKEGTTLTPLLIYQHADQGDEFCLQVIKETAHYLGIGIATVVHTVDPAAVIIGGAMTFGGAASSVGQHFLEEVRGEFKRRAYHVVRDATVIEFASLGATAGYIGAAGIARAQAGYRLHQHAE